MAAVSPTAQEVADYITFFFEVPRGSHPHDQFELRLNDKRFGVDDLQKKRARRQGVEVWHLLHGYLTNFYRTQIPADQHLPIMFSPYISLAAFNRDEPDKSEFPDVNEGDLPDLVKEDTDQVYLLQARLNGRGLTTFRLVDKAANIEIKNGDNVLGLDRGTYDVYYNGHFVKLEPLPPGDHLIESRGYAPNYENDVRYSVYTRAGGLSS